MNLGELIQEFRVRTQDQAEPYLFPDEELIPWFNEAEEEAAIRGKLIRDSVEIPLVPGQMNYDLPAGLFDIQYAELLLDGKFHRVLNAEDRRQLDRDRADWRSVRGEPIGYIHDEKSLCLVGVPDAAYTVGIEYLRTPVEKMAAVDDEPEIHGRHHEHLIDWVLHKAYSKPDAETLNPGASEKGEAEFTRYFGNHPGADCRRRQNASRPHRTKSHW